ncbi:Putative membrane protein (plasmid) [Sphingopyxis fribergensis]|uniref:Putative membrane protein n=1 Tax=Sphingopyxis fribergensis TaxID=1515612 RepID=A0A0A7PUJ5_9SPHN|nr:disulfide bond formation protein B [Sphingopyxis fribergensis]AJA11767.1 Putative membrane protein [Sphingopyxis fribergensis]
MSVIIRETRAMGRAAWLALLAAGLVALTASLGVIFIGEVMGQTPCVLCWFQRAFMFPLAIMLAIAAYRSDRGVFAYAVPLAAIGWVVALYHLLLYQGVIPEAVQPCGAGPSCADGAMTLSGGIPLPLLSLGAFSAIIILIFFYRRSKS